MTQNQSMPLNSAGVCARAVNGRGRRPDNSRTLLKSPRPYIKFAGAHTDADAYGCGRDTDAGARDTGAGAIVFKFIRVRALLFCDPLRAPSVWYSNCIRLGPMWFGSLPPNLKDNASNLWCQNASRQVRQFRRLKVYFYTGLLPKSIPWCSEFSELAYSRFGITSWLRNSECFEKVPSSGASSVQYTSIPLR